jgi:hypothetical protein
MFLFLFMVEYRFHAIAPSFALVMGGKKPPLELYFIQALLSKTRF